MHVEPEGAFERYLQQRRKAERQLFRGMRRELRNKQKRRPDGKVPGVNPGRYDGMAGEGIVNDRNTEARGPPVPPR